MFDLERTHIDRSLNVYVRMIAYLLVNARAYGKGTRRMLHICVLYMYNVYYIG